MFVKTSETSLDLQREKSPKSYIALKELLKLIKKNLILFFNVSQNIKICIYMTT